MPGKRKGAAPAKADEAKRRQLSWNLTDQFQNRTEEVDDLIDDSEIQVAQETDQISNNLKLDSHPSKCTTRDLLLDVINECDYYVEISSSTTGLNWFSKLGTMSLTVHGEIMNLDPINTSFLRLKDLFDRLPISWLYINGTNSTHVLYFEWDETSESEKQIEEMPQEAENLTEEIQSCSSTSTEAGHKFNDILSEKSVGKRVKKSNNFDKSTLTDNSENEVTGRKSNSRRTSIKLENEMKAAVAFSAESSLPEKYLECLKQKDFRLILKSVKLVDETVLIQLDVCLLESSVNQVSIGWESFGLRRRNIAMQNMMCYFFGFELPDQSNETYSRDRDIISLYNVIRDRHSSSDVMLTRRVDVQHEALRPCLRPYQRDAVMWMLQQENFFKDSSHYNKGVHSLYRQVKLDCFSSSADKTTEIFYYNLWEGILTRNCPTTSPPTPGGILADEMGLGKTVEVLACVLLHPRVDLPPLETLPVISEPVYQSRKNKAKTKEKKSVTRSVGSVRRSGSVSCSQISSCVVSGDKTDVNLTLSTPDVSDTQSSSTHMTAGSICSVEKTSRVEQTSVSVVNERKFSDNGDVTNTENANVIDKEGDNIIAENDIVHIYAESNSENTSIMKSAEASCSNESKQDDCSNAVTPEATPTELSLDSVPTAAAFCECVTTDDPRFPGADSTATVDYDIKEEEGFSSTSTYQEAGSSLIGTCQEAESSLTDTCHNHGSTVTDNDMSMDFMESDTDDSTTDEKYMKDVAPIECVCGESDVDTQTHIQASRRRGALVSCMLCGARLHACCVNYDLTDPHRGRFVCPHCHVAHSKIVSGATLIVTPSTISEQWVDEILKHINKDGIQLFVYTGVHRQGYIQPNTLSRQDIVLTTYETLRKEIDYVDLPHKNNNNGRKLRHPKRFMAIPSPITCVEWWRICLDEAQMVETTTTKTAEMALRLSCVNRWCVTGTPIQRNIEDLYGLFLFLNIDPYFVRSWWTRLLQEPYYRGHPEPLYRALSGVFWRSAKKDVIEQIGLPEQTVKIHWLTFSPVEQQFYQRQYEECANEGRQKLSKLTDRQLKLNSLDKFTLHQILQPLRKLRQACCHPQAVRGSFLPLNRCTMTMDELLVEMLRKVKYECEDARRQIVFAHNGLAGLHVIRKQYKEAVDEYRTVLRSADECKDLVRTDDLQLLHTICNLNHVLPLAPSDQVGVTLRESSLTQQEQEIRDRYTQRHASFVTSARETWLPLSETVTELKQLVSEHNGWWAELIQWTIKSGLDEELVNHVKSDLTNNVDFAAQKFSISRSFRNARGLEYILTGRLDELDKAYEDLLPMIKELDTIPSQDVIQQTVQCCLRPVIQTTNRCEFCKVHDLLEAYEFKLYMFIDKGVTSEPDADEGDGHHQVSTKRKGTWADSETEKMLKSLCSFVMKYASRIHQDLLQYGQEHLRLFEALKKEFKPLRGLWVALKEQVGALDELSMATTRLRLREPDEPMSDPPEANVIEPTQIEQQRLKFQSDRILGETELKRKKSQYLYLQSLSKAQSDLSMGLNPELCPICRQQLGKKWTVLQCGHCYCLSCTRVMVSNYSWGGGAFRSLRCAMCRCRTRHADISYVSMKKRAKPGTTSGDEGTSEDDVIVKGDHSTKIEGVVKCLMKILSEDSRAKILVFSTWQDVLDALDKALRDNSINFRSLRAHNRFDLNLHDFKHTSGVSVLLLPVHSGANGLNLIEAKHVVLVEPILNTAQELQAIGRVHRIGQTQATCVHRFIVRGTIEEYIHSLLQSSCHVPLETRNSEETTLTIGDLHDLFHMTPGDEEGDEEGNTEGNGNEVEIENGNQIEIGNGNQIEIGNGNQIENGNGNQVEIGNEDQVENGNGNQVENGNGNQIEIGNGNQVENGNGHQDDV